MSSWSAANWTEGHPEELARQFLGAVERDKRELGPKNFVVYVKVRWEYCRRVGMLYLAASLGQTRVCSMTVSSPPSQQQALQLFKICTGKTQGGISVPGPAAMNASGCVW
jgi:hypothetical protein